MEAQPDSSEMAYHADSVAVAKGPTLDAEVDNNGYVCCRSGSGRKEIHSSLAAN